MHFDNASIRITFVVSLLVAQAVADTVVLSQFQRITGFPDACTQAYDTPISGCTSDDFINGNPCSQACVQGLNQETTLLNSACLGISTSSSTLIGLFFEGKGVQALCPKIASAVTTAISAAPEPTTSIPAVVSSSQIESTTSSSITAAAATTTSSSSSTSSAALSTTLTTSSESSAPSSSSSSSSDSSTSSSSDSSSSQSSSPSSTDSSTSTQAETTLSTTTASVQTSINIPLGTSVASPSPTGVSAFGGQIGNLGGGPISGGSRLCPGSLSILLAAGSMAFLLMRV